MVVMIMMITRCPCGTNTDGPPTDNFDTSSSVFLNHWFSLTHLPSHQHLTNDIVTVHSFHRHSHDHKMVMMAINHTDKRHKLSWKKAILIKVMMMIFMTQRAAFECLSLSLFCVSCHFHNESESVPIKGIYHHLVNDVILHFLLEILKDWNREIHFPSTIFIIICLHFSSFQFWNHILFPWSPLFHFPDCFLGLVKERYHLHPESGWNKLVLESIIHLVNVWLLMTIDSKRLSNYFLVDQKRQW